MILPTGNQAGRDLRARILSVLPAASFQMDRLLSLAEITPSLEVETAAVECRRHPRLLVNPRFVEAFCRTDEHLFMLVMHELFHVVLGHTRLFPRPTPAHNVAFDAVINAMLCRQFSERRYVSFFQEINAWDSFPARLLRPPPGWPERPRRLPPDASEAERRVHAQLYGDEGDVTYHELFELLVRLVDSGGAGAADSSRSGSEERTDPGAGSSDAIAWDDAVLLGDHSGGNLRGDRDEKAARDPILKDVLRRIVERWPPPPVRIAGRDEGRQPTGWVIPAAGSASARLRAALRRLLRRAGVLGANSRARRRLRAAEVHEAVHTVLPQARDRQAHAWRRLYGTSPVLWRGTMRAVRRRREPAPIAHVYLDISGSMSEALPHIGPVLVEPHRRGEIRLFVFSTVVDEARPGDLSRQSFANTFGTDIGCVLAHLGSLPHRRRPRRVVLLTDGYVGSVLPETLERLRVDLYVGHYAAYGPDSLSDLAAVAKWVETLPDLGSA